MQNNMKIYWGDMHTNIHLDRVENIDLFMEEAKTHVDFFPIASYPFPPEKRKGMKIQGPIQKDILVKNWRIVQEAIAKYNSPEKFVTFLGYEWQDKNKRRYGHHNVFYLEDYQSLDLSETLPQLFKNLKKRRKFITF